MASKLERRQDDKLQNMILERLGGIECKIDTFHQVQEEMSKVCITKSFEIEKTEDKITNHLDWHRRKKKRFDKYRDGTILSLIGTILFLARDKIAGIISLIFK